ncbi:hypothetical protein [Pinibacter aurantiacus]|uniref:Uncharacterized protein n=1 Tax=Pinibacter aurantiacus TaxID=2851599 RepID=A0A9E2SBA7_9BACT|nr:hypothetical protein [Pinibacter aurantiacus]MBV4359411.1 hypothetical protein [Pinibacter aurantiacus]
MERYRRKDLNERCFALEIFECPKEIILFAAELGSDNVTIENFRQFGMQRTEFKFEIQSKGLILTPSLKGFDVDFSISKIEFLQFIDVWDEQGCYAVFHDAASLKLKATNLADDKRYRALTNFGWTIEIAIPGSASDGWGQITSPNKQIIEKIEDQLRPYTNVL